MKVLPSITKEGTYNSETMDIKNLISIVENSELDKFKIFNITYHLLGNDNDRFYLDVRREKVKEYDCDVISYKLDLDGFTTMIFYLIGDEVKILFVSELFNTLPKSMEEDYLRVKYGYGNHLEA